MRFVNNDKLLLEKVDREIREQKVIGLEGLVGALQCIIINTEIHHLVDAAQELLDYTGFELKDVFKDHHFKTIVLSCQDSADVIIRTRLDEYNPFQKFNKNLGSYKSPNTRLETFVFETNDINKYLEIQKKRGLKFSKSKIIDFDQYYYLESEPSENAGISYAVIQWKTELRTYRHKRTKDLEIELIKKKNEYLDNIFELDHVAVRVKPEKRDDAIIEFMKYTNYSFEFAIYVESLNSITNVTRMKKEKFALVFTSGIEVGGSVENFGPTQKFIHNYGVRPHHMAFRTENIDDVVGYLKDNGMTFLLDLVGSKEQGLKQIFSSMSKTTMLVNEYIQRFDEFDGFFTKENVKVLTKATENQ